MPGDGLRDVLVGRATPKRVLAVFGTDAKIQRYSSDGDISEITYVYNASDEFLPTRPGCASRPATFKFDFGLLSAITISVHQAELYTTGGIRIRSPHADVLAVFGTDCESLVGESFETLRYIGLGIELNISRGDDFGVTSFVIFRQQRA
ncbi:MAG: hypothetical protein H0T79_10860 [Deltaproteobacteria bacterium]|nr:hypothetical protein [Deltaproteobacteria bacterium]